MTYTRLQTVRITKEAEGIDAGHRVPNHASKCRNPHGHRYRIVAHAIGTIVDEPGAPDEGMLVDFGVLKEWLNEVHAILDHGFIVYEDDRTMIDALLTDTSWKTIYFPYIPTAENIARWVYEKIAAKAHEHFRPAQFRIACVEVWETPTSMARFPDV